MVVQDIEAKSPDQQDWETLFEKICADIETAGYSINPNALPELLANQLLRHVTMMSEDRFERAGIGRSQDHMLNDFVRSDEISWINGESEAGQSWLDWTGALKNFVNRRLFLGLFSFESHFSHYAPGHFYKRHIDAFKGESNRVLTLVVYLNPGWQLEEGGELVLYLNEQDKTGIKVVPGFATLVAFLSEEFPHEVLPARRDRFSIAGWYRLNNSLQGRIDPPR